jgi:hypothetical protein
MTKQEVRDFCEREFEVIRSLADSILLIEDKEKRELFDTAAMGAFLLNAFTGMERVIEKVLVFDALVVRETGEKHTEILRKAFELGILPHELYGDLGHFLAFREYFGRAYVTELSGDKLSTLANRLPDTIDRLEKEILEYIETV